MGLGILGLGFWVAAVLITGRYRKLPLIFLPIFLLLLWNMLSIYWSIDIDKTLLSIGTYLQMMVMFMMIWELYSTKTALQAGLQAYVLGACVALASLFANFLAGIRTVHLHFSAADVNSEDLALMFALGIPIAWHLATSETSSKVFRGLSVINYAYIPAAAMALLITANRGPSVAALPGFLFILASMVRLKLPHRILIFTVLAIAVFALFPLVPRPEMLRVAGTGRDILAGDFGGRLTIWREGIEVFYEHPILGVGSGAIYSKIPGVLGAHNVFLSVLVQVGIIGLALYATILAISIHYAISQPKWDSIFWCTLLLIWAIGNISNSWVYREPTWLILGLVAASAGLYVRNKDKIPLQVSPNEPRESPDYSV
jgi:O-antigen ligase